jgi:esterase/lipase superfamily enzyme
MASRSTGQMLDVTIWFVKLSRSPSSIYTLAHSMHNRLLLSLISPMEYCPYGSGYFRFWIYELVEQIEYCLDPSSACLDLIPVE